MLIHQNIRNMIIEAEKLGAAAYAAYRASSNGKSHISGQVIPEWKDLPIPIQTSWRAAAMAVKQELGK